MSNEKANDDYDDDDDGDDDDDDRSLQRSTIITNTQIIFQKDLNSMIISL